MAVNFEVKGILARLLANEDIIVIHKNVSTASFNVETRTLTLPMWKAASEEVYDLLVAHECGHSIYSPQTRKELKSDVTFDIVNIVEDIRIEKLMKNRYPGLSKTFYKGYKKLSEDDFLKIGQKPLSDYNFADRINIHFKIGNFVKVPFNDNEKKIVDDLEYIKDYDEVIEKARLIKNIVELEIKNIAPSLISVVRMHDIDNDDEQNTEENNLADNVDGVGSGGDIDNNNEEENENKELENENENENGDEDENENEDNIELDTVSALDEFLESICYDLYGNEEMLYLEYPDFNIDNIIIPNSTIHKICNNYWENSTIDNSSYLNNIDSKFNTFKKTSNSEVNYLVKEFECKKAADLYSRSSVSSTGVLNCSKLHTYKYSDDIFKRIEVKAMDKNHGLIFLLDWSGSMSDYMLQTLKQLYNLIWFCKKVSIPFEVYAFTDSFPKESYNIKSDSCEPKNCRIYIHPKFSLMNILSSNTTSNVLNEQMRNLFRVAYINTYRYSFLIIPELQYSGTPLNESLISLNKIIPKFKNNKKIQKVHCIVLTDGESSGTIYHKEYQNEKLIKNYLPYNCSDSVFLRDRTTGNVYAINGRNGINCDTNVLLKNLKHRFPDVSFIGIRIINSQSFRKFIENYYYGEEFNNLLNKWKKEKSVSIKKSGYHSYLVIQTNNLQSNYEFKVQENFSKTDIKNQFVKSLDAKKTNKKILSEFINLIV